MNELQLFNFNNNDVRALMINDEPWFVGKDVAIALGYKNTKDALSKHVDEEDKMMGSQNATPYIKDSLGRKQYPIWVNESGIYSLIFGSKLKEAKEFKHWVTSEVLPQLRKTGSYSIKTDRTTELAKAVLMANEWIQEQQKTIEKQSRQLELQQPKVKFANAVSKSEGSILIRDLAKIMKQNGNDIGGNRLWTWLRDNEYICKTSTMPTQKAMDRGLFEIQIRAMRNPYGRKVETKTTRVTPKGQIYFINKLCKGVRA